MCTYLLWKCNYIRKNKVKDMKQIAGYILAGGNNRRMQGSKKLFLPCGDTDFLGNIMESLSQFPQVYLSVARKEKEYMELGIPLVADQFCNAGPLGGILSGLLSCEEEGLFVVPCDIPVIGKHFMSEMRQLYERTGTPVIVKKKGRYYPFPGIYTKSLIPVMKDMMEKKDYKVLNAFNRCLEGVAFQAFDAEADTQDLHGVNTWEEYEKWRMGL